MSDMAKYNKLKLCNVSITNSKRHHFAVFLTAMLVPHLHATLTTLLSQTKTKTSTDQRLTWPVTDQWLTSDWPVTYPQAVCPVLRRCLQSRSVFLWCVRQRWWASDWQTEHVASTLHTHTHTHTHTLTDTLNSDPTQFPRLWPLTPITTTTSSAITVRCQLKSCRLLHSCTTNHMVKGLQFVTQGDWN